jgi:hypothetical protein
MNYITVVGHVDCDPWQLERTGYNDFIRFPLCDHNGIEINCTAPFQLAHHIRKGDHIMCFGRLDVANLAGRPRMIIETIHEQDELVVESHIFILGGAL